MKKSTRVNHPPAVDIPSDNRPVVAPIHQTVKFEFPSVDETLKSFRGERSGFFYQRSSNPTTRQLELLLAELQGRDAAIVCGSGVNAIAQALFSLTRQGDHVLCFIETYGPTRHLIRRTLARFGVTHTMLSITDVAGIERTLATTKTRLICFESPTNPVTKIADIPAITRAARAHGALTLLDNTLAGFHQHGEFDIDIFVHSLTKYASGHGDVMGGAVIAGNELIKRMRGDFTLFGGVLDPHAAFLVQRGLKTYFLRYREQCAITQQLAEFLHSHPAVARVHYPGLPDHPQHALAKSQLREFGSLLSFDMKAGAEAGDRFADALQLFALAASLGSTDSLVIAPQMLGARDLSPEQQALSGVAPGTVRLSIGIEAVEDLIADLEQALAVASK
jgi:cystathionine beta-lyase/cystathionine gamma-synthase